MRAQLEHTHRPGVAAETHPLFAPPLAPAPALRPATAGAAEPARLDRDVGLGLLFRFIFATSVMVAVVVLAQAVGQMWILVPAMAVHFSVTFYVLHGIFRLVNDGYESDVPDAH